jgi:hypothetical protein
MILYQIKSPTHMNHSYGSNPYSSRLWDKSGMKTRQLSKCFIVSLDLVRVDFAIARCTVNTGLVYESWD